MCQRSDCGTCVFCKDKPKFGGPGKRKQCCEKKKCQQLCSLPTPKKSCLDKQSLETKKCLLPSNKADLGENSQPNPMKPCSPKYSISEFLKAQGRKIHPVMGDGSCLFRALAFAVLKDEDQHSVIRSSIVRLINLNNEVFTNYLMCGVNCSTITEQVRHMSRPGSWGTHLEIIAAATLFQISVYYCTPCTSSSSFTWGAFHPISSHRISFPLLAEDVLLSREPINHIELYYHQSVHYDAIVPTENEISRTPPQLTGETKTAIIVLDS